MFFIILAVLTSPLCFVPDKDFIGTKTDMRGVLQLGLTKMASSFVLAVVATAVFMKHITSADIAPVMDPKVINLFIFSFSLWNLGLSLSSIYTYLPSLAELLAPVLGRLELLSMRGQARRQARRLTQIIPDSEWDSFRQEISKIASKRIPALIEDGQQLQRQLAAVERIRAKRPDPKTSTEFERDRMKKTDEDYRELEAQAAKNATDLRECLTFLDHLESSLYVARRKDDARQDLQSEMTRLIGDIEDLSEVKDQLNASETSKVVPFRQSGNE